MDFFNNNNFFQTLNNSFNDETNTYKKIISEEGIKKIKYLKYKSELFKNDKFCPITQKQFIENCKIAKLPCEHIFEPSGILFWLKNEKPSCPVCRYEFDYIEIKNEDINDISNNLDLSNNVENFSNLNVNNRNIFNNISNNNNNIFEFTFDINNANSPYNFNIRYNLENLFNTSNRINEINNSNTDNSANIFNLNADSSANIFNLNADNSDISNNTNMSQTRTNLFNTIENEIINTFTNIYFRKQEEMDLEKALLNSLQDK